MQKSKLLAVFTACLAVFVGGVGSAATLSYQGTAAFSYTDPACTTSFTMDANGNVSCTSSSVPTTPVTPSCSIAPANPTFSQNGSGVTLTANCINNPASFNWTLDGVQVSSTASYAPPTSLTPKSYTVTLAATNVAGTGTAASTNRVVTSPATTPQPTSCSQTVTDYPLDFAAQSFRVHVKMNRNQAYAFGFTTDNSGRMNSFETAYSYIGDAVVRFINVSEQKCDFSYTNFDTMNGCAASGSAEATLVYTLGQPQFMACQLKPNTKYYVNVRNENPALGTARQPSRRGEDSCAVGQTCGFVFAVH